MREYQAKISIILVFALLITSVSFFVPVGQSRAYMRITMEEFQENFAAYSTGDNTVEVAISSREDLVRMRTILATQSAGVDVTFVLTEDIKWSEYSFCEDEESGRIGIYKNGEWEAALDPVTELFYADFTSSEEISYTMDVDNWKVITNTKPSGTYVSSNTCYGVIDGNGHKISGIYQKKSYTYDCFGTGLFCGFSEIRDLYIENGLYLNNENKTASILGSNIHYIKNVRARGQYILEKKVDYSGFIAVAMGTQIEDCEIEGFFYLDNMTEENVLDGFVKGYHGVIVGFVDNGCSIQRCRATGVIRESGEGIFRAAGGIAAYARMAQIEDCECEVNMEGSWSYAGGIVGWLAGGAVERCLNYGDVSASVWKDYFSLSIVGGICGMIDGYSNPTLVNECENYGTISQDYLVGGGIVGEQGEGEIINCENFGNVVGKIVSEPRTYNTTKSRMAIGGLVGRLWSTESSDVASLYNSANHGSVSILDIPEGEDCGVAGGIVGQFNFSKGFADNLYSCEQTADSATEICGVYNEGHLMNCYVSGEQTMDELLSALNEWLDSDDDDRFYVTENGEHPDRWVIQDGRPKLSKAEVSPSPTVTASATPSPTATASANPSPTVTASATLSPTPTANPTATASATPSSTPMANPTATASAPPGSSPAVRVATPTPTPGATASAGTSSTKKSVSGKLRRPTFTLKRGKTSGGIKYIRVKLKKYEGKYLEIYVKKDKGKYARLKLSTNKISKLKGTFKLKYSFRKSKLRFKIRTYKKKGGKKRYSFFSKIKTIKV